MKRTKDIQTDITANEWADTLDFHNEMKDGHTSQELAKMFGVGRRSITERIRKSGDKVEHGHRFIIDQMGRKQAVKVYRILK